MQTRYNTILRKQKGESREVAEVAVVKSDLAILRTECSSILGSMKEFKRKYATDISPFFLYLASLLLMFGSLDGRKVTVQS